MSGIANWQAQIRIDIEDLKKRIKVAEGEINNFTNEDRKVKLDIDTKTLESAIQKLDKMLDSLGKGTGDFKQFENLSKELSSIVSEIQSLSKAFGKVDDSGTKTLLSSIQNIDKSLSELNQNILNVNKNMSNMGGNTSGAVKQVENITNESKKAASALEDVAKVQEKVNRQKTNISSGSNPAIEQQNKLQEELKETQTEIIETRSKYQSLLDVAKKQLDDDKGTNYYSGKTTETKAFDNFTFNEQAKRSSHFDVWSKDYEELCSLIDKTEEELESGSIGFDDAIDRMVSAYQKYDTATKIDVGGFDFLDGVENVPSVLSDTEKAVLNENKAIKESEYTLQDYINTYLELKKVKESSLSVNPKITGVTSNGRPIIKDGSDESFKAELMMKDMESEVLQIYGKDLSALADEHIKASESAKEHAKAENQVTQAVKEVSSTASQDQKKDAFPSTEATASVEKTTQAIKEENNALEETANKAKQAVSELVKGRDVVNQNWYREKGTVVGKDSKGNDITRDADEFSFVERLKNGQLQTVLATYNEETGKWAEQVINVRTAFEQVEKAIINTDNKIAFLEMAKDKTLAAHPGYDATADDNQIALERKKRDELQATLNLYGSEKEYVFEIEAATKRIADNQERLNNKKQSQTNLRQAVSDEKDAKANEQANKRDAKQAQIEAENIKLAEQKTIYNELNDSLDRYLTVSKRIENGKALEGDYEEAAKLQEKIEELQNNPILSQEQLDASQRKLDKIETTLEDIATAKAKSDSVKVDSENVKNIQAEWGKNIKAIQDYMDAVTKLNNLKAKDKGLGTKTADIEAQQKKIDDMRSSFESAQATILSFFSSIDKFNSLPVSSIKEVQDAIKLIQTAANGSSESVNRLEEASRKMQETSIDKLENKLSNYQKKTSGYSATINKFGDDGWTSPEYLEKVQKAREALSLYQKAIDKLKANPDLINKESLANVERLGKDFEDVAFNIKNMTAAQKGYTQLGAEKALDKISQMVKENSKMSRQAKADIKAWYDQIASGNPSASLDVILGKVEEIVRKEKEAGRGGKSMWDKIADKVVFGYAAQLASYFLSFSDFIRYGQQAISIVVDLNTQITELAKVSEQTSRQIYSDFSSYADIAKDVGGTISDTISATADWSKNGYNIPDSKQLAEISQLYKNVGDGIDITSANESLISTLKGFQLEADQAEHIVDVFNEVSNNEAISSSGIGEALQRSAASFNAANTSLEQSVALITATNTVLQNVDKTGNMWKIVSARIRGAKTEIEEMGGDTEGMVESTSKLQSLIKGMTGVDILESDGKTFKDMYTIVSGIADKWATLDDIDQAALLEALAGKQQSNALSAALQNPDILKKAYEEATNATGSARKEQEEYAKSIQYSIDVTKAKLEELANDFLSSDFLKGAIDAGGKLIDILDGIVKSGNAIPTVFAAISAALSFKNVGGNKMHFPMNILDSTYNLLWIQRFRMC